VISDMANGLLNVETKKAQLHSEIITVHQG